jgi:hypothetical protein
VKNKEKEMLDYSLEHIFSFKGKLATPEMIGPVPEGIRVNFYTTGGEISGPKLRGKLLPVGGDWFSVRKDGIGLVDVRSTIESDDGALILFSYQGIIDFGNDGYEIFLSGDLPASAQIRTSPRFSTSHPAYVWLNRLQCIGIGEFRKTSSDAMYDVYAVR